MRMGGGTALVINNYFAYEQMTLLVRKDLAMALRNLLQHGLTGALDYYGNSTRDVVVSRTGNLRLIGRTVPKLRASVGRVSQRSGPSTATGTVATNGSYTSGVGTSSGLLSFGLGCFGASGAASAFPSLSQQAVSKPIHAWEVILFYYDLKVSTFQLWG